MFYTFCRLVDDIADAETLPPEEKGALLQSWRGALTSPMPDGRNGSAARGGTARLDGPLTRSPWSTCWKSSQVSKWTWKASSTRLSEQLRTYCPPRRERGRAGEHRDFRL